ncbi:SAV_2336 N-terminal domain-related protein [Streptomyces sp. NPDC007861]|uniref:SAV_2336 N-terminal domain-related protein n=1 Tax=Streptomyces sp. NPDC007861 TaxID=3154893 RepID=UPI0033ED3CB0
MPDAADARTDTGAPPAPRQDPSDPMTGLVAVLREAGLEPDPGELADALWLARWSRPTGDPGTDDGRGADGRGRPRAPGEPADHRTGTAGDPSGESGDGRRASSGRFALYPLPPGTGDGPSAPGETAAGEAAAEGPEQGGAVAARPPLPYGEGVAGPVGVPAATALPGHLELQRALRALQRYRPAAPPVRYELDEEATAERSARAGGAIIPVLRPVVRSEAVLQLVMDASSSMQVWDRLFAEIHEIFGRLGAFRDIRTYYLHARQDGTAAIGRHPDRDTGPLRPTGILSDPTGRHVTLLISDCAGGLWRSGRAHSLLHRLAAQAPVAVLQPLPQRLWQRTRLPASYGKLTRGEGSAAAVALRFSGDVPARAADCLPVPVLPPEPAALGAWARLLSGLGAGPVPAAVGWVPAEQRPSAPAPARAPLTAQQLVSRFRSTASSAAGRLAGYLAAAPLCLPVMQLVQRTMLPDAGPAELSEVLLGGLLTRVDERPGTAGQWYEFADGVRDVLLRPLSRDEALLVLKHCSEYVEQHFGKGGPNFPALAIAQLTGGLDADTEEQLRELTLGASPDVPGGADESRFRAPQPFAEVAAQVMERFLPVRGPAHPDGRQDPARGPAPSAAVRRARVLVERFEADGMVQSLLDAVQLLRRAAAREQPRGADPGLWGALAENLLRLWRLQGGGALLREAREAAQLAASHPRAVRERAVLARVLHAEARDRLADGDRRGALELLRRADREYTAVGATSGLEPPEALRVTLERARVLEEQWRIGGDASLLQETVGMLEAFADVWPDRENRPSGLALERGRALLRLAGAAPSPEQAVVWAGQAAQSLENGRLALEREGASDERLARAALDQIDALLLTGGRLDRAEELIERTRAAAGDRRQQSAVLTRSGRLRVRRYEESARPDELEQAAAAFAAAGRLMPRDGSDYAALLAEWGDALLRRAALPGGEESVGRAVRVLRDCRMETPAGHERLGARLLALGRALMLRHRATGDRVDLREAEHVFGLAAQAATEPLVRAECWLELGDSHRQGHAVLHRPERLDEAADAYRRAAETARSAAGDAATAGAALRLAARANHLRGVVYEAADRPRAARDAYRAAQEDWRRLPDGGGPAAQATARRLAGLDV